LIARYAIDAKLFDWSDEITADCPRKAGDESQRYLWRAMSEFVEGGVTITEALSVAASPVTSSRLMASRVLKLHRGYPIATDEWTSRMVSSVPQN
jgi:hypothetical protein